MDNITPTPQIRIFVGAPVTDRTEQRFLARLIQHLIAVDENAVVLANFEAGSVRKRQVDFLIATDKQSVAVEIKGYRHPVQGAENGEWIMHIGSARRGVGFPYAQARDNRFNVCDALKPLLPAQTDPRSAISGMLCIYPEIPNGSSLPTSNHKLSIGGFEDFTRLLSVPSALPLHLDQWVTLAASLGLTPLSNERYVAETAVIDEYVAYCADLAEATSGPFVAAQTNAPEGQALLVPLIPLLVQGVHMQIAGPSGVGKSRLIARCIVEAAQSGAIPVAIAARDFEGKLLPLLRKAIARASQQRFETLLRAADLTGRPIVVFVDALNECPRERISDLLAALQTVALRYGATILLTGQTLTELPSSLSGQAIELAQPDRQRAQALVEAHLGRSLESNEESMLEIIGSAQDASVLAEVLVRHKKLNSRFELYHAFTTDRLPASSHRHGLHEALGDLSKRLRESFATKISVGAAARLLGQGMRGNLEGGQALAEAEAAALVVRDYGEVRFRHDLIADYFTTDRMLRQIIDPNYLHEAMRPINVELQEFVLGGCSDSNEIMRFLDAAPSDAVIDAALCGRCGELPRQILLDRCRDIIDRIEKAYRTLQFCLPSIDEKPPQRAEFNFAQGFVLSERERRDVAALSAAVSTGLFDRVMQMLASIDQHLWSEAGRLRAENPEIKRNIPAMVFGSLYGDHMQPEGGALLRILFQDVVSARFSRRLPNIPCDINAELDDFENRSPGQLFLLLSLHRSQVGLDYNLPTRAGELAQHVWRLGIYHLRLLLTDLIHFTGRRATDNQRAELYEILTGYLSNNAWYNMILFDAISAVGEIDFGLSVEDITEDYEEIARLPLSKELGPRALSSYTCTYDHPASDLFCEAFNERISDTTKSAVLIRALGDPTADSMSLEFVIRELGRVPSTDATHVLMDFTVAPSTETSSPQSSVSVFCEAIGLLARMGIMLISSDQPSSTSEVLAWQQVRNLIHAFNVTPEPQQHIIDRLWNLFRSSGDNVALDVLFRIMKDSRVLSSDVHIGFIGKCDSGLRELCLAALRPSYVAASIFQRFDHGTELTRRHRQFAFACLGVVGRTSDRAKIEDWIDHPLLGADAIRAIRAIEAR